MRQKLITLCPTSFELAGRKANFSAWVRRKLLDEVKKSSIIYGAYCKDCDLSATHRSEILMEYHFCTQCYNETEYLGVVE